MGFIEEAFPQNANIMTTSGLSSFGYVVKVGSGKIYTFTATNDSSAVRVLKIYDKATAVDPTSDTPIYRAVIGASATHSYHGQYPIPYALGLNVVALSTISDAAGGSPGAGYVPFNMLYS
jgi:hypothetical protein